MKEENEKAGVRNKKLYLYIALGCAAVLLCAAIIVTAVVLANRSRVSIDAGDNSGGQIETPDPDQPVIETPEEFISPVSVVSVLNEYGFYYNKTLGNYYEHMGVDFTAEVGSEVYAVASGTVESVYTSDVLVGTQITIDHGDGVKSVYQFVEAKEGLKAGDEVKQGDVIATVAEANGSEYKDGAHLHFEVFKDGANVDPAEYLTLEEK
ncbi:MAG TPA: M23 family metallopeptidase [Candidatus Scatosoma pullicola]|nr:M23 family metallopeptidase [Candidatus Scatosoma pullicola]